MTDKKITDVSIISTIDETNDVAPMVDVSDTTEDASGTLKKFSFSHIWTYISGKISTITTLVDSNISASANIAQSKIANLVTDLANKSPVGHLHAIADVTSLQTTLNAKQDTSAKNQANGYAGLDGNSKLTGSQQVYGTGINTACEGNDSRLSDQRVPIDGSVTNAKLASSAINGLTEKVTPEDNDEIPIYDSTGAVLKKIKISKISTPIDALVANKGLGVDATGTRIEMKDYQSLDSNLTAIAGLAPTNDDVIQRKAGAWTNRTMAQIKTDLALTKSDVGLANVDNTSDVNKPISTATQTALDGKSAVGHTHSVKQLFCIVAEEGVDLNPTTPSASGQQFSYGNGSLGGSSYPVIPYACQLVALSLSTITAGTYTIEALKNAVATGAQLTLTSTNKGYVVLGTPVSYAAGDGFDFKTVSATAGSGVKNVVTAWFERTITV